MPELAWMRDGAIVTENSTGQPREGAAPGTAPPLLEMRGITKGFPGVRALKGVSLDVRAGEVRALLGENGAGKSTLMNILAGVFSDYGGEIRIDGHPVSIRSPLAARNLGIAMIHQELNLIPELSVADNIFLGRELHTRRGTIDRKRMHRAAAELLAQLDLTVPPTRLVCLTRIAEQQLIEVVKALSLNARILIMDEPTSALADAEVARLFTVIRRRMTFFPERRILEADAGTLRRRFGAQLTIRENRGAGPGFFPGRIVGS
jgi:ABC-type sugar transport system ATPase subunit